MKPLVKIALLDTHDLSRHGFVALLEKANSEVQLVHVMTSLSELDLCLSHQLFDVLFLDDTDTTPANLCQAMRYVLCQRAKTAIVILSHRLNTSYIQQLIAFGAKGFITKSEQLEDILLPSIRMVSRGEIYLSPKTAVLPYEGQLQPEREQLTLRDVQVLQMLREGLTVKEIANILNLESKAVYRSRWHLKEVLGVRTNEQIVPVAHARGLL